MRKDIINIHGDHVSLVASDYAGLAWLESLEMDPATASSEADFYDHYEPLTEEEKLEIQDEFDSEHNQ